MPRLYRNDRSTELDAIGHTPEHTDSRQRVEIAGHLRNPHRCESGRLGRCYIGNQTREPFAARTLFVRPEHQADAHKQLLVRNRSGYQMP